MAPNLKKITLIHDYSLTSEIDAFRLKADLFVPLQQQLPAKQQQISVSKQVEESASYWDWETMEPLETVLTLEHVESNLLKSSAAILSSSSSTTGITTTNAESDDYWAEQQQDQNHPQHDDDDDDITAQPAPVNYWDEACHDDNRDAQRTVSDKYWEM
mmetsp:Transcript_379/g.521  ORF Transcript_379/g.521 Transcript_379/m.521 type:complete len:158 (-) Transcript_379:232-705(-)|eukprot:CAMPEP_0198142514 /NCGR_PEP_ID=MMETSP1443-20131203/5285_1 /TAXON_ID=186043 /ORGANISM="Entomoneis sp., Strain CCMP2396" /LENGTH=157 /DNA_ID=CAMNT_0043805539 /DNA_START=148 /DNA_END=621 /DNA_ORIENTATION=+